MFAHVSKIFTNKQTVNLSIIQTVHTFVGHNATGTHDQGGLYEAFQ